jgi:hypothetical protein
VSGEYFFFREGVQFSIRGGGNIPWMKIDPGVNLPWGSKYQMTLVLSSFMTHHLICNHINTSTTSGTGATYLSRAPEFTPVFTGVCVTRSLVLCVCFVDHCLSFCQFLPLCCPSFDLQILITLWAFAITWRPPSVSFSHFNVLLHNRLSKWTETQ